jgi:hypothetical protein
MARKMHHKAKGIKEDVGKDKVKMDKKMKHN